MSEAALNTEERKKPGPKPRQRSAAGLSVDEAHREGITMGDGRDPNTAVEQERIRIPLDSGMNHSLNGYKLDEKNFHHRWFHESQTRQGRVAAAEGAFYEHCTDGSGEIIKRASGAGHDYLMRLPMKYYKQDVQRSRERREKMRLVTNTVKGSDKLQEYGVDAKGRPVFEGDAPAQRSVSTGDNPYV